MEGMHMGWPIRSILSMLAYGGAWAALLGGAGSAAELVSAKGVQELSVSELLAEIERPDDPLADAARRDALTQRALDFLLSGDLWNRGEYATIRLLAKTAEPKLTSLTEERKAKLEELLVGMASEDAASFEQLQARVALLDAAGAHDASAVGAVEKWLSSRDLSSLGIEQIAWCLAESLPDRSEVKEFTVVWEGMIKAPRSAEYEFSTTPINVNRQGRDFVKHTIVASVGDVEALHTPQEPAVSGGEVEKQSPRFLARLASLEWKSVGSAVALAANQSTPIRIEMHYEASRPTTAVPASAILFWKGPGLERQPVAEKALVGPGGEQGGLRAEYRWSVKGERQTAVEESAIVDGVWLTPSTIAPVSPALIKRLSDRLWSLAASEEYLQRCAAGEAVHIFCSSPQAAETLSSARRQEFLELLVAQPGLLGKTNDVQLLSLYKGLRFGAEEAAIDLLGTWMQQHADVQPEIVADFFEKNRRVYWELGQLLATQQPEMLLRLREDYLMTDDEHCALPVAYTLSYGYLAADRLAPPSLEAMEDPAAAPKMRFEEWSELLAEKADDKELDDSLRINWLLARAHAEEAQPDIASREDYLTGSEWLQKAKLLPGNETDYARVFTEEVARLVSMNHEAQVRQILDSLKRDLSAPAISKMQVESDHAFVVAHARRNQIAANARNAYVAKLRRRRAAAAAQSSDTSRYDKLLADFEEEPSN